MKTNNTTNTTKATKTTKAQETKEKKVMKTTKTNATKTNNNYSKIYDEFKNATCKKDLVDTLNRYGIRTNTTPTTTPNKNDLYVQFNDKSRLLITTKSLKVYTNDEHATKLADNTFYFDNVSDGSYRTKRATVSNTLENFTKIFTYFEQSGCLEKLPALAV